MIFWYLYWFQIFKNQCGSVPVHICSCPWIHIFNFFMYLNHQKSLEISKASLLWFQASFHIASAFFGMIIGKSGTTRKRIESETRSRINVPKQGASSDPNSKIPISIRKVSLLAGNPNQKSMKIPDMFFQIPNSNQYFHYFFDDYSSSIGIARHGSYRWIIMLEKCGHYGN